MGAVVAETKRLATEQSWARASRIHAALGLAKSSEFGAISCRLRARLDYPINQCLRLPAQEAHLGHGQCSWLLEAAWACEQAGGRAGDGEIEGDVFRMAICRYCTVSTVGECEYCVCVCVCVWVWTCCAGQQTRRQIDRRLSKVAHSRLATAKSNPRLLTAVDAFDFQGLISNARVLSCLCCCARVNSCLRCDRYQGTSCIVHEASQVHELQGLHGTAKSVGKVSGQQLLIPTLEGWLVGGGLAPGWLLGLLGSV